MLRNILLSCLCVFRAIEVPTSWSDIQEMVHAALHVGPGAVLDFAQTVYETRLAEVGRDCRSRSHAEPGNNLSAEVAAGRGAAENPAQGEAAENPSSSGQVNNLSRTLPGWHG
jgi:hypothetical protein